MSILLEALRKSEKNQNSRKAPTIHTDDQSGPVSEKLQTGPLVLLLIIALFVIGWFVWRQYQPPADSYEPPVTLEPNRSPAVSKPAPQDQGATKTVASSPVATLPAAQPRTPVESYQAPPETSAPVASRPKAQSTANNSTSTTQSTTRLPSSSSRQENERKSEPAASVSANEKPAAAIAERYRPGEPEPIGYWELPDSVRADVPEMKFSVLVYASDPKDRFVLINGERLSEGDSARPGLVVKEIRRDGVVFSYRLYQFLVER